MFACEICEISKNTFSTEHLRTSASTYKLKSMGISGKLYNLLVNYLSGTFQRVALNEQTSSWKTVLAGFAEGLILGPIFFLIYTNDLSKELKSNAKFFADDTYLMC